MHHEQYGRSMKGQPQRQQRESAMLVQRARSVLRESRKLFEQPEGQLQQMERFIEDIQVNIKQVWKRKNNGVTVSQSSLRT
jgi:hypothetical protein